MKNTVNKEQVKKLILEAVDEQELLSHLLEDIGEAFIGIERDLAMVSSLGVEKDEVKKLISSCQKVSSKLESMS